MNKWVYIIAFIAGLLLLVFLANPASAGYEEVFQKTRQASWAIYVRQTGGVQAICSSQAFKTTKTHTFMLTAGHCFIGNDLRRTDFMVTRDHKNFVKAELVRSGLTLRKNARETSIDLDDYSGNDWVVISAMVGHQPIMPIGDSEKLVIGEDLVIVGVPFGLDFLAVQGVVGSKDMSLSSLVWNHYYGANIFSAGGNSGSGVISPKQGAIVGIVNAGPGSQSTMMIFLPVNLIPKDVLR